PTQRAVDAPPPNTAPPITVRGARGHGLTLDAREQRALALVDPAGSGDRYDAALVAKELARLPEYLLARLEKNGTRVIACRSSVADGLPDLTKKPPRGWPPGRG